MQTYNFEPISGEYINAADARLDPMETEAQGQSVYLLPANATFEAPPITGENETAVWMDGAWQISTDYRGQVYYDTATGERRVITKVGIEPDPSWTDQSPGENETWNANTGQWEPDLSAHITLKIAEIDRAFSEAIAEPVIIEVGGVIYRMDGREDSARRMDEGVELASRAGEPTIDVIDYDNVPHVGVSLVDGREIATRQGLAYRANYYKRAQLRYLVMQAASIEALSAISWA